MGYFKYPTGDFDQNAGASGASQSYVDGSPDRIPDYSGEGCIVLHDNQPLFNEYDFEHISGETYSDMDRLGRCGTAMALLDQTMMPKEERGEIGQIKPTGWRQNKYEGIVNSSPPYLYNFQLGCPPLQARRALSGGQQICFSSG